MGDEKTIKASDKRDNGGALVIRILSGIGVAIVAFIAYCIWVNSHWFEGNFFGMTFQMPFEGLEHYCSRKSEGILTIDTGAYYECLNGRSDVHKRLVEKMKADRDKSISPTASYVSDKMIECMANVTEKYYSTADIENYIKTGVKLQPTAGMNKQKVLDELEACAQK